MCKLDELEMERQQKKEEMVRLIDDMQMTIQSGRTSEVLGKTSVERQKESLQGIKEMQAELQRNRNVIESTIKKMQEGMQTAKELQARAKAGEDVVPKIRSLQAGVREKKKGLEEAIKEMELLKEKYVKLVKDVKLVKV